ncbi:hypothetical protein OKJ48_14330 [Streptomyces kunmingensis]|uniref:Uncharacterized protein n=1 Tax=Streptomyces kunmingensis TaxID=68225 RepID=A0ABU6CB43_9ACTN|nr:hypothetical protein [Streptomyces kunmingensis]MEB3961416.1 hypothetical protein [Streptomyces kunmingensis]
MPPALSRAAPAPVRHGRRTTGAALGHDALLTACGAGKPAVAVDIPQRHTP